MFLRFLVPAALLFTAITSFRKTEIQKIQLTGNAQGTTYQVTYYAADSLLTRKQVDSLFAVMDSSMSLYKPGSLINRFNQSPVGIDIDAHLGKVVSRSLSISRETDGLFDITVQPLVKAWGFGNKNVTRYPNRRKVRSLLKCVGIDNISLSGSFLNKTKPCITIDVNGIAQGYTVDLIADFLENHAAQNYIVEVGGEIRVKGKKPDGSLMKVGIEAPGNYENEPSVIQKIIALQNGAITTSGNYRKFHESKGKKFSHTIHPKTGYPIQNELVSVTVIAPTAMDADGYDNVLMALGLEKAMEFVEQKKDLAAYFIFKNPDGTISDSASNRFKQYFVE